MTVKRNLKKLDDKDRIILEMLIEDARRPYHEIGKEVGLSESTVRKRVIKLKENGIIERFTIRMSTKEEGGIWAFLTISAQPGSEKDLLRELQVLPQCKEIYALIECGVLVKVSIPDITELDALVESFRARADVKTIDRICVVLKPIKYPTKKNMR